MPDESPRPPVPLADVEVAQRIATAARTGGPAERTPTVAQLLAAFGESGDAGPAAVARVQRALALAGVAVSPALADAPAGTRVTLSPVGAGGRQIVPLLAGAAALIALLVGVAVAAGALGGSSNDGRASSLPAGTTTAVATATTAGVSTTTPATTTAATTASTAAKTAAAEKQRKAADAADAKAAATRKRKAQRAAAATARRKRAVKAAAARRTAGRRRLVVRLTPGEPSYACIDDASGKRLFGGTLARPLTLRAKRMRLNIGLSTVRVTVNGKRLVLSGSPSGYLLRAGKAPQALPLGARPSC